MSPLESLFRLEIEFHRCLRRLPTYPYDFGGLHTSYALQAGYEPLIFALGPVSAYGRGAAPNPAFDNR